MLILFYCLWCCKDNTPVQPAKSTINKKSAIQTSDIMGVAHITVRRNNVNIKLSKAILAFLLIK